MSGFSTKILDDILSDKKVVLSSKISLISDEIEVEDEEVLDNLDDLDNVEDEEVLDDLDNVEDEESLDELDDVVVEDEEALDELDKVGNTKELSAATSPSEELKAFSQLEEVIDNFIINSNIDFSAHPKLKEFAQNFTEELETTIDELRQEKNDSLFEGVVSSKKVAIKADKTIEVAKGPKFFRFWLKNYKHVKDSFKGDVTAFASLNEEEKVTFSGKFSGKFTSEGNAKDVVISLPSIVKTDGKDVAGEKRETLRKEAVKILTDTLDGRYFTDISDLPSKVHILSKKVVESAVYQGEYEVAVTIFDAKGNLKKVRKKFKTEDARAKWIDKQEESGNLYEVNGYLDPEN